MLVLVVGFVSLRTAQALTDFSNRRAVTIDALQAAAVQNQCVQVRLARFDQDISVAATAQSHSDDEAKALAQLRSSDVAADVAKCIADNPIPTGDK